MADAYHPIWLAMSMSPLQVVDRSFGARFALRSMFNYIEHNPRNIEQTTILRIVSWFEQEF